jgi:adenine phosphoribosyltransferase
MDLKSYIRDIQDFPTAGVVFKDITPLLQDKKAFEAALIALVHLIGPQKIDKVVGMESRGFFFGPLLASHYKAGFVPVRKTGKLPAATIGQAYQLEYGSDLLEIHRDSIQAGEKVLIHDDVLATGGTAKAACRLVERLGGEIVLCNFLIELDFLNGRDTLKHDHQLRSLLHY